MSTGLHVKLPVAKLGYLLLRTLCKPIASRLKGAAGKHPRFRERIINLAQRNHRFTTNVQRRLYGRATDVVIRPLNEEKAVQAAADLLGEVFVFSVAGAVIVAEVHRSTKSEARKEELRKKELEAVKQREANLATELELVRGRLSELEQLAVDRDLLGIFRLRNPSGNEDSKPESENQSNNDGQNPSGNEDSKPGSENRSNNDGENPSDNENSKPASENHSNNDEQNPSDNENSKPGLENLSNNDGQNPSGSETSKPGSENHSNNDEQNPSDNETFKPESENHSNNDAQSANHASTEDPKSAPPADSTRDTTQGASPGH